MEQVMIQPITYRNKQIDRGVLLDTRPYRWTLKKKYSPCYAIDLNDGVYVSELSPHKKNFQVYIPVDNLKPGHVILAINKPYKKEMEKKKIKIIKVNDKVVEFEILNPKKEV